MDQFPNDVTHRVGLILEVNERRVVPHPDDTRLLVIVKDFRKKRVKGTDLPEPPQSPDLCCTVLPSLG